MEARPRALLSFKLKRHIAKNCGKNRSIYSCRIYLGFYSNPFLIFIGLFVIVAAQMETQHAASKFILKGFKVRDILMKQYHSIDVNEPIKTAITLC
jgi:hypothetical protein